MKEQTVCICLVIIGEISLVILRKPEITGLCKVFLSLLRKQYSIFQTRFINFFFYLKSIQEVLYKFNSQDLTKISGGNSFSNTIL